MRIGKSVCVLFSDSFMKFVEMQLGSPFPLISQDSSGLGCHARQAPRSPDLGCHARQIVVNI